MMKSKLFDYVERDNFIYNLSGVTKLLGFLFLTFGSMYAYDIRIGVIIMIFSFAVLHWAEIKFSQIKVMMYYVAAFLVLNFILTFVFSPQYAVELYGTKHEIFAIAGNYVVTWEQLLYQLTKTVKYAAVVPLGMLFLLTTNPSEFAASLNGMKVGLCGVSDTALLPGHGKGLQRYRPGAAEPRTGSVQKGEDRNPDQECGQHLYSADFLHPYENRDHHQRHGSAGIRQV